MNFVQKLLVGLIATTSLHVTATVLNISNPAQFQQIMSSKPLVIVKFYANWCSPCKSFAPIFDKVSEKVANVTFVSIDVDKHQSIANQYGVSRLPTILYFKNGSVVAKKGGSKNASELRSEIQSVLGI